MVSQRDRCSLPRAMIRVRLDDEIGPRPEGNAHLRAGVIMTPLISFRSLLQGTVSHDGAGHQPLRVSDRGSYRCSNRHRGNRLVSSLWGHSDRQSEGSPGLDAWRPPPLVIACPYLRSGVCSRVVPTSPHCRALRHRAPCCRAPRVARALVLPTRAARLTRRGLPARLCAAPYSRPVQQ